MHVRRIRFVIVNRTRAQFYLATASDRGPINLKRVLPRIILVCDNHDRYVNARRPGSESKLHSSLILYLFDYF